MRRGEPVAPGVHVTCDGASVKTLHALGLCRWLAGPMTLSAWTRPCSTAVHCNARRTASCNQADASLARRRQVALVCRPDAMRDLCGSRYMHVHSARRNVMTILARLPLHAGHCERNTMRMRHAEFMAVCRSERMANATRERSFDDNSQAAASMTGSSKMKPRQVRTRRGFRHDTRTSKRALTYSRSSPARSPSTTPVLRLPSDVRSRT